MGTQIAPNWLSITGMVYALYGMAFLAGAIMTGGSRLGGGRRHRQEAGAWQQVTAGFAIFTCGVGFLLQILAQTGPMAYDQRALLLLLGLVVIMLVYLVVGEKMVELLMSREEETADAPSAVAVPVGSNGVQIMRTAAE